MHTLNHALAQKILEADGCYLDAQGLQPLEQYVRSYTARLETYRHLRDQNQNLVLKALRRLAQIHPELVQQHGRRCQYDMTEVLRYIALSILRDDEVFFQEQMAAWLNTILLAHKRTAHCMTAYRYLQEAIAASLPDASSTLVRPYLDRLLSSLQTYA